MAGAAAGGSGTRGGGRAEDGGTVLLIGSSILRLWPDPETDLGGAWVVDNQAFGGSVTAEVLEEMGPRVEQRGPRVVVYYCGSNDLMAGIEPSEAFANFATFAKRLRGALPRTELLYVSVIRSPAQILLGNLPEVDEFNGRVRGFCAERAGATFVGVGSVFETEGGQPRPQLFTEDFHHLRSMAYQKLGEFLQPHVAAAWAAAGDDPGGQDPRL